MMLNDSDLQRRQVPGTPGLKPMPPGLYEGFPIMVDKLIETGILLSTCISTADPDQIARCEALARDIYAHQEALTRSLLTSKEEELPNALIHLPFLLQKVGENLEGILNCCSVGTSEGILLNGKADAHLQQFLAILVDMMNNLRDAFTMPDAVLVESIISKGSELNRMLREFRSSYWSRPRTGSPAFQATSVCLDILDAIKSANEDVESICHSLLELEGITSASAKVPERADSAKGD